MNDETRQSSELSPNQIADEPVETPEIHCDEIASLTSGDDDSSSEFSSHEPPIPRWLLNLIGHVIAGAVGLGLGYLILNRLRPSVFPLPW